MRNLIKLYEKAGDNTGLLWYQEAHQWCKNVAVKYNLELAVVCAVVSALSPSVGWEQNKRQAVMLIRGAKSGFSTYRRNVEKARAILRGDLRPDKAFNPRTGPKTYNFFHNLLNPECDHYVTIDRHAVRIATGDDEVLWQAKYEKIANHYRNSAKKISILPSQLQASLWVSYRKENNIHQAVRF